MIWRKFVSKRRNENHGRIVGGMHDPEQMANGGEDGWLRQSICAARRMMIVITIQVVMGKNNKVEIREYVGGSRWLL